MTPHPDQRLGGVAVRLRVIRSQGRGLREGGDRVCVATQCGQNIAASLPCLGEPRIEAQRGIEGHERIGIAARLNKRLALVAVGLRVSVP